MAGTKNQGPNDANASSKQKIPAELAEHVRKLSHDLSNALEVILQTNYLLGMGEDSAAAEQKKWREMMEKGVAQAASINKELREYMRANS